MTTDSPPRWYRRTGILAALAVGATLFALPSAASAAEGEAPAPQERTVLGNVHTDAISTFYENGELVLASKADVPERATRYDEESLWFHVSDDAIMTLPDSGLDFIAPAGSDVWMAPMSQNPDVIWPGFSTESVPAGAFDGDATFTLLGVDGPGDVELFLNGAFGGVGERLWSSDETSAGDDTDLTSFSRPSSGIHMHANWVFTAPGIYDLTVRADATKDGAALSDTATYTFVIGELPDDVDTTTTLRTSASEATPGDEIELDATVTPAVDGYVEFLDGTTVLGHSEVVDGAASFARSALGLGKRSLTARYVPAVENLSNSSTSTVATVTVAEEGQEEVFGVYGLRESYAAGDTIDLRPGGYRLRDGETFSWLIRSTPGETEYAVHDDFLTEDGRFVRDATSAFDGAQLALRVVDADRKTVHESAWVSVVVTGQNTGTGVPLTLEADSAAYYRGDTVTLAVGGSAPAEGETMRAVTRTLPYATTWQEPWQEIVPAAGGFTAPADVFNVSEVAIQLVAADGTVLGQSPAISADLATREIQISGVGAAYRLGEIADVDVDVFPATDDLVYDWGYGTLDPETFAYTWTSLARGGSSSAEIEVTQELVDAGNLELIVEKGTTGYRVGSAYAEIRITDAEPGEQELFIDALAGHYHQGNTINLRASAFPEASAADTYRWWWQRPDQDEFVPIEGATSASTTATAEQALDGTLVKAEMLSAAGEVLATSDTATIHVDDHGVAPRQKASIQGLAEEYRAGDEVALTASVSPSSVLTRWEWYVQKKGDEVPMLVEGRHDAELSFAATGEYDDAAVFARLAFEDGRAYVESSPVLLNVAEGGDDGTQTTITIDGLADRYNAGDTMTLDAHQAPDTGEDHWHWFIRAAEAGEYDLIADQATSTLTREVAAADDGASIIARLYDHDHKVIAESEPVVMTVDGDGSGGEPQVPQKPVEAPQERTGDELDESTETDFGLDSRTFTQGQVITLELGEDFAGEWTAAWLFSTPTLLGGDWIEADSRGAIAVRVPVDARVGEHRLAVFADDGSVIGWTTISVVAADGTVPTGALPATGGPISPLWMAFGVLFVGAGAGALVTARRRRVRAES